MTKTTLVFLAALAIFSASTISASPEGSLRTEKPAPRRLWACGSGGSWSWKSWSCKCFGGWKKDWAGRCVRAPSCSVPTLAKNVDLKKYIEKSWYIQMQQPNGYQPRESLNCVVATYEDEPNRKVSFFGIPLGFNGKVISVYNYANTGGVNAGVQRQIRDGQVLCSRLPNPSDTSKLLVAPCFLPNWLAGDYWILAVADDYSWAVVSGGKPTVQYSDGCTTKEEGINGSGLWVFTRKQTDDDSVAEALKVLKAKGYTTQRLVKVPQAGCKYEGARIK